MGVLLAANDTTKATAAQSASRVFFMGKRSLPPARCAASG
jgi:hypothetical protein